ncbi:MAG: fasciclin domain-containing protein [Gammaproteobacteria bacterium]
MQTAAQATPGHASDLPAHDIVDTAVAAGNFSILVNAIKAADLVTTLKGAGPFTVFAPTDDAFRKLPAGTVDGLLKDKAKLASILTYHVVPAKIMAKDVKAGEAKTVEGSVLTIALPGNGVTINNAKVVKSDIETSNGVIHSIDTVLMPR